MKDYLENPISQPSTTTTTAQLQSKGVPLVNARHATSPELTTVFERKEYVVTDTGCQLLCCFLCPLTFMPIIPGVMGTKTLVLDEEEVTYDVRCGICNVNQRRPYGELGSVDKNNCLCCIGYSSGFTAPIYPGCGCDDHLVTEIVEELKRRMKARGDTGQIRRAEQALDEIASLRGELAEVKQDLKAVLQHFNISSPQQMERS
jgi:hypothetical protein